MSVDTTLPGGDSAGGRPGETAWSGAADAAVVDAVVVDAVVEDMVVEDLVAIFCRVLEIAEVASDADFFVLGGDSLVGTRVLSAIARGYGVEFEFGDLLAAPTPRGLAEKIAAAR